MKFDSFTTIRSFLCLGIILGLTNISLAQPGNIVWHEDWEGPWGNDWVITGSTCWEVGSPTSGPNNAYMGQQCAATNLSGDYGPDVESQIEMINPIVVPDADEYPRLRFWHWFDIGRSDGGKVRIKVGQGDWEIISDTTNSSGSGIWSSPSIDLRAYAGESVKIGFYFTSDGNPGSVGSGWYIDEVSLVTGQPQLNSLEDWEAGLGDWYVTKGTWEVGIPTSGPNAAYQGQNCAATVLSGNYAPDVDTRLTSPYFVIPDTASLPKISFWHWYDIGGNDYGELQLRVKGGGWQPISGRILNSSGGNWISNSADLTLFKGDTVQVCFFLHSDGGTSVKSGWYIDNIELPVYNVTGIDAHINQDDLIRSFALHQNYPNPFNPSTTIRYYLQVAMPVEITIYNIMGMEIRKLLNDFQPAGIHSVIWDGRNSYGNNVPSGAYIYQLQSGKLTQTHKMMLIR